MNNKHIRELYSIFIDNDNLQKEHKELWEVIKLIDENIDLVEKSNKIQERLQEIMKEK